MAKMPKPLTGPPPKEVSLPRAPLARAIAQVGIPKILAIRNPDNVATFQEIIRSAYPFLSEERVPYIVVQPVGTPAVEQTVIWRFQDNEVAPKWRASLSPDFLALETTAYPSRKDFLERLHTLILGFEQAFNPTEVRRLGVRHINRLTGDAIDQIAKLLKPQVLGIIQPTGDSIAKLAEATLHMVTEAQFLAEEGRMQVRWGSLPSNVSIDPVALEPIDQPSWVIDLDMFIDTPQRFNGDRLISLATKFAERIYSVFREMVTDDLLRLYGGKL